MTAAAQLLHALECLSLAYASLDAASGGMGPLARGAAVEIKVEIQGARRRLRRLALHLGVPPARVEDFGK